MQYPADSSPTGQPYALMRIPFVKNKYWRWFYEENNHSLSLLRGKLALNEEQAHIAKFSEYMCDRLIVECEKVYENQKAAAWKSEGAL